ncbi:uncharacterized protein K02A2.6-like [Topomyia yanbarensis]|uniref:uncharacterized protein K02A2.6-like n=1 Tax=Topomyia yanbarensis TaxID=2498891 RepID=UPI00273CDFF6|nr:uncharacterized protein K02A2.6-like [Topomyia yanbarensis]
MLCNQIYPKIRTETDSDANACVDSSICPKSNVTNAASYDPKIKTDISFHPVGRVQTPSSEPRNMDGTIIAEVAGMRCIFLIDSGAQVNTFTKDMFRKLINDSRYSSGLLNIQYKADRPLKAYASGEIAVIATFDAKLYISNDRPTFLEKFYVVNEIYYDKTKPPCRNIFLNIPLAVKPLVEERLQALVVANIIEPVKDGMDTSFCSSMLVVPKGKDDIRMVIDLRGPNQYIHRTPFSMPTLERILAELDGAQWFSTIDLENAFFHIELDEDSRHLTNFFTEYGMFRCVRLPFGLCNAPDIFQETLQRKVLGGCKGCKNYLDDILVFGKTKAEHDENLAEVRARLDNHNVKINESKCVFSSQSVKYIGFTLTPEGWQIEDEKITAISNFRRPENCLEVKSFLGLITFIDKFIVHRATKTEYLRLLANSEKYYWTDNEEAEFNFFRETALDSIKRLGYYSPTDRIELFVDASPVGLGAVLTQFNENEIPRIIACASKVLTAAEQRYPQTQKEALAVVWGVERFSYYLLTRTFTIRTDAEANQYIFNNNHRLGKRAVSRAEGWALRLQPYDYSIQRVPGNQNVADVLSRLIPAAQQAQPFKEDEENHFLYALDSGCMEITWSEIESHSEKDSELQLVRQALMSNNWPTELRCFEAQVKHLHVLGSLVCKDDRVILPYLLREKALKSAHGGHVGEVAMKRIMRGFFWWPRMSSDVARFVKNCNTCTLLSKRNPPLPLANRDMPTGPWEFIQIDFLSIPKCGHGEFLVVIDIYSRYLSVVEMKAMDAESTNLALSEVFQMWGCPLVIQSDNGPPFQSAAFTKFWEDKGIKVRKSIPLSPQSNGAVERQNQGIIKAISASRLDGINWRYALQEYVHKHNTLVPHSRLRVTPFELMVGWKFRGTFPSLWSSLNGNEIDRADLRERDAEAKLISKKHADSVRGAKESDINVGDTVLLAQSKKSKTDSTFSPERYQVIARQGAKVVVMSKTGIQYARNVQEVKRVPVEISDESSSTAQEIPANSSNITSDDTFIPASNEAVDRETGSSKSPRAGSNIEARTLRKKELIIRPTRFDDKYIYHLFC